jgi:hypothetical protein
MLMNVRFIIVCTIDAYIGCPMKKGQYSLVLMIAKCMNPLSMKF